MPERRTAGSKRPRNKYSRLICLGCHERRIRCELPSEVEIPNPGELRTAQTPCYRCKRLGVPCVIRQTILGRPSPERSSTAAADLQPAGTGDIVSRIIVELPLRTASSDQPAVAQNGSSQPVSSPDVLPTNQSPNRRKPAHQNGDTLLVHKPQSTETVIIIRALDIIRRERVEDEWFRHLPTHVGHTRALDLSIKALVTACAHARGAPKLTSEDCYSALSLALQAVQENIRQTHGEPDDATLASTALLAPFEGVMRKHGILTRLHVEGLGAILGARRATYPVSRLAREIVDFHAAEYGIMACILDTPSPFEGIARAYYANDRVGCGDGDRAQLRAFGNELFIRIPRLVGLVRSLRLQRHPRNELLLDALRLSGSLLELQDPQAEARLLQKVKVQAPGDPDATSPIRQSLRFASVRDFEALAYYWQSRLSLLRLERRLHDLCVLSGVQVDNTVSFPPCQASRTDEIFRLAENILMCTEYGGTLPLRRQVRVFAHAMVTVWGVMTDTPAVFGLHQDVERACRLLDLLLRRANMALEDARPDLTVEDMDTAADIFVGGQPKGKFAEVFGL